MPTKKALLFSICGVKLGVSIEHVGEVLFNFRLHQAPEASSLLRGFAKIGSTMVPIVKLEHLLHFGQKAAHWKPENDVNAKIIWFKTQELGFHIDPEVELIDYDTAKMVRLPKEHVLNDCIDYVLAMPPPQPSILLIEPQKLLLSKERSVVRSLLERERDRLAQLEA